MPQHRSTGASLRSATSHPSTSHPSGRVLALLTLCLVLGLATAAAVPGCAGCRKSAAQRKKEAEERKKREEEERRRLEREKPKPNFEATPLGTRPDSDRARGSKRLPGNSFKPGHWTATTLAAKTNNFDFLGDFEIAHQDNKQRPVSLPAMPFRLTTSRQVALPKGQPKVFESIMFVPPTDSRVSASCRLSYRKGGRLAWSFQHPISRMPSYQYHLVVLARWPDRYSYLNTLHSIAPPVDTWFINIDPYYRVSLMQADRRTGLPSYGLLWTSTACIVWDDAEPDALGSEQQRALLDWLHWGGQLIVSGPDSLDTLAGSFLAPYLPAAAAKSDRPITAADFQPLVEWSRRAKRTQPSRPLQMAKAWTGLELKLQPPGSFIPHSGDLLAERRVGRGRVVVSAFRLHGRELTSWPGFDEVFNGMLLRRPGRKFTGTLPNNKEGDLEAPWAGGQNRRDAALISRQRYFARDSGVKMFPYMLDLAAKAETPRSSESASAAGQAAGNPGSRSKGWVRGYGPDAKEQPLDAPLTTPSGPGLAAWNDFSAAAHHARGFLLRAAQIEIPERNFVVYVVACYLLVLVPANWFVFRLIGRVEWAWAAAPVIAVVCTIVVIRLAQLDIGFARLRTELAVVELQGDYPRAHVTRYTALYTSLATRYDFRFDDPGAMAMPFPIVSDPSHFHMVPGQRWRTLRYRRSQDARMDGLPVGSNTTELVHAEQMLDLGGAISLAGNPGSQPRVVNSTGLTLHDAVLVSKDERGNVRTVRLGTLVPEGSGDAAEDEFDPDDPLDLGPLVELAQNTKELEPGEVRLVATAAAEIPGMVVRPTAPQTRHAALVIAHLKYAPGGQPKADVSSPEHPLPPPRQREQVGFAP